MPPRAFSILEVMVALAIVVALASVVLPSLGARLGDEEQRSTREQIEVVLAMARQRAIAESRPISVEAMELDGVWRLREFHADDPEALRETAYALPNGFVLRSAGASEEVESASSASEAISIATFFADGSALASGEVELARGEAAYRLVLGRWSSRARFELVLEPTDDASESDTEPPSEDADGSDQDFNARPADDVRDAPLRKEERQ